MKVIGTTNNGSVIVEWEEKDRITIEALRELVNGFPDVVGRPVVETVLKPMVQAAPAPDGLKACLVCGRMFKPRTSEKLCGETCRKQRSDEQKAEHYRRTSGKATKAAPAVPSKVDRLAAIKAAAQRLEIKSNPLNKAAEAHRRLQEEEG